MFKKLHKIISELTRYITGDFAYDKYLEHHKKHHKNETALDKKTFLQQRLKKRQIRRCC